AGRASQTLSPIIGRSQRSLTSAVSRSLELEVVVICLFLSVPPHWWQRPFVRCFWFRAIGDKPKGMSVRFGSLEAKLVLDQDDVDPVGQIFPIEDQLLADEAALAVGQLGALIL